jgi:hypothetical protein
MHRGGGRMARTCRTVRQVLENCSPQGCLMGSSPGLPTSSTGSTQSAGESQNWGRLTAAEVQSANRRMKSLAESRLKLRTTRSRSLAESSCGQAPWQCERPGHGPDNFSRFVEPPQECPRGAPPWRYRDVLPADDVTDETRVLDSRIRFTEEGMRGRHAPAPHLTRRTAVERQ